jgi:alpha-galactosidase
MSGSFERRSGVKNLSRKLVLITIAVLLGHAAGAKAQQPLKAWDLGNLAPTPIMGWANWNAFFCDYNDQTIRDQADALVSTGMRDAGYKYVVIQECIAPGRTHDGQLIVDPNRFPNGIKPLVDYIHSLGLKAGIYTDVGKRTCFPKISYEGSFGHEKQDADTFAAWGIDFVEMDYCFREPNITGRAIYERMAQAIKDTGRPMIFYLCSWGNEQPWEWAQGKAQGWRTENDISFAKNSVLWDRMLRNFQSTQGHAVMSGPESWNDADMLEVGNRGITDNEAQTHMSLWAIAPSIMLAGTDLTKMSPRIQSIYTNKEVIAINQDALGAGAELLQEVAPGVEVWAKPLGSRTGGEYAVMLLNTTIQPTALDLAWPALDLAPSPHVRDVWAHRDVVAPRSFHAVVKPHEALLLRVRGTCLWKHGVVYEAEWPGVARLGYANLLVCAECTHGYAVGIGGEDKAGGLRFSGLQISTPGDYVMRFRYTRSGADQKKVRVTTNGIAQELKVERKTLDSFDVPVQLKSGDNVLEISYDGAQPFYVDNLTVFRVDALHPGKLDKQIDPYHGAE